ncbi:MAG: dethiobiotin synthase [bacterium]|nr:dethiobiotin synthase [bacterium]
MPIPSQLFVAGTDTDVGKTLVSAVLTLGLKAHYFKPFQTGRELGRDAETVARLTGLGADHFSPDGLCLEKPLSPHLAARLAGLLIDPAQINLPQVSQKHLVVEGAGGLLVPLNERDLLIDWLAQRKLPVVLVARSGLGTINHSLLSIEALRLAGIPLLGVVLNGPKNPENAAAIAQFGGCRILAQLEPMAKLDQGSLLAAWNQFSWE